MRPITSHLDRASCIAFGEIEGLHAKRAYWYIGFWADFHFLQDCANFWQTDLFWHGKRGSVIFLVRLCFVLQK